MNESKEELYKLLEAFERMMHGFALTQTDIDIFRSQASTYNQDQDSFEFTFSRGSTLTLCKDGRFLFNQIEKYFGDQELMKEFENWKKRKTKPDAGGNSQEGQRQPF